MKHTKILNEPVLDALTQKAHHIHTLFNDHNITAFNVMASPGAGKTSLLLKTIQHLKQLYRLAVIEGDIVPIDVDKIKQTGVQVVLAHTGGSCHLDSIMMESAIKKIAIDTIDLLFVENVGNLICPANFYLGTHKNVVIASVPEGDDKPYKYPTMFQGADVVILNKIDYLNDHEFNIDYFIKGVLLTAPNTPVIQLSTKTDKGFSVWIDWLTQTKQRNQ